MILPKTAVQYLVDETRECAIPLDPPSFLRKRDTHEHLFFGHVPVRAYKNANRWKFDERDIRHAARTVAALPWNPDDLIAAGIPARAELESAEALLPNWRRQIRRAIDYAANRVRAEHGCPCGPRRWDCSSPGAGPDGLPCGLSWDTLLEVAGAFTIACTRPIPSLHWVRDTWLIPRTLAFILDGWQQAQRELTALAGQCSECGARVSVSQWRTATANGWKVLCPPCASASARPYRDELQGATYARVRERGPGAEDFLCVLCARPAAAWDHCHDPGHGLIRGPLCGSCNGAEWQGKEFLKLPGSVKHLLRCARCREQRTLPRHHGPAPYASTCTITSHPAAANGPPTWKCS